MSRMLEAYRVKVVTSKNVEDGATKGGILWLHSPVEDAEGYFYFVSSVDSDVGIPLAIGQVEREKEWDRYLVEKPADKGTETPVPAAVESVPVSEPPTSDIAKLAATLANAATPAFVLPQPIKAPITEVGVNPRGAGLKFDAGKPRPSLLIKGMPRALMRVTDVLTFGAAKYEAHSWKEVENGEERYDDAKLRHMFKEAMGEKVDDESMIEHLAHEICNGLFLLEKLLVKKENAQ